MSDSQNLENIIKSEEDKFSQCWLFTWEPNPEKDRVRVILDDGTIRMTLKRDKFISLMLSIMNINHPGTDYNFFRIKDSLRIYGGWFFYDRNSDEFLELQEMPNFERITSKDLISETRKDLSTSDNDIFRRLSKVYSKTQDLKSPFQPRSIKEKNTFSKIIRNFSKNKKS